MTSVVDLDSELLGFPKRYDSATIEVEWCCPRCDNGRGKFNLVVNLEKNVFHCWACDYRGTVRKLVYDYGDEEQKTRSKSLSKYRPRKFKYAEKPKEDFPIESFRSLRVKWTDSLDYNAAMNYLKSRKITKEMIDQWDICFADEGDYAGRVIVPSKDIHGKVEYFIARDIYDTAKIKYKNPRSRKNEVIFGEKFIDWTKPVLLVEGVFDAMVLYNAIPLLGTKIDGHTKLIRKIMKNKTPIILGFDADVSAKDKITIAKYLKNLGISLYILSGNQYNDLAEAHQKRGRGYIVDLIRNAREFDELDIAMAELENG